MTIRDEIIAFTSRNVMLLPDEKEAFNALRNITFDYCKCGGFIPLDGSVHKHICLFCDGFEHWKRTYPKIYKRWSRR